MIGLVEKILARKKIIASEKNLPRIKNILVWQTTAL